MRASPGNLVDQAALRNALFRGVLLDTQNLGRAFFVAGGYMTISNPHIVNGLERGMAAAKW